MLTFFENFIHNTLDLALIGAPWLVVGLVFAGLMRAWLPRTGLGEKLSKPGAGSVTRAAVIGAPLPLCSCGVLPAAFGLRRAGASKGATTSFLIATPETGVDSIALSYVLLGPVMAVLRPLGALFSAITAGLLVDRLETQDGRDKTQSARDAASSCCGHEHEAGHAGHGHHALDDTAEGKSMLSRTFEGQVYAFTKLLDDLSGWLAVGFIIAGLAITAIPENGLAQWGSGPLAMLLMIAVSIPIYVCAAGSTPLALAMLHAGVSPGTVLVFLLAGPATNFAGLALIRRELGWRPLIVYLGGVCGGALVFGLGVDALIGKEAFAYLAHGEHAHIHGLLPLWLTLPCLAIVAFFALSPLRRAMGRLMARDRLHDQRA